LKSAYHIEANTDVRRPLEEEPILETNEERFQTMANSIPQLAWMAEADGHIVWYNQRWFDYTGTTSEEMESLGWGSVHDPRVLQTVMARWEVSITTGQPFEMEFPLRGASGLFRVFLTRIMPLKDVDGHVVQWFGTSTDLSQRFERQQVLQESADRYRLAIEEATDIAIWDIKLDDGGVHWNDPFAAAFGIPPNATDSWKWWVDQIHPDDRESTSQDLRAFMEGQELEWTGEYRFRRADGRWADLRDRAFFSRDESGKISRIVRALMDLSERKSAAELNVQLAAMVETAEDAIVCKTLDGTVTSWNAGAQRLFGYTAEEMIGRPVLKLLRPDQREEETQILLRLSRGQRVESFETVRVRKDGSFVEVSVSISPIRDGHGRIIGASKIARDITERKKREAEIRRAQAQLRDQAEILELAQVTVRDMEGRIVQWNLGAERLYGFSKEEVLGRVSQELFRTEFPQSPEQIEETLHRSGRWEGELVRYKQNGERLVVYTQWVLHRDPAGNPVRVLEIDTDITERTRAQKALEIRSLDLQQFAYIASHDLKTPLRTISGFVELLQVNYSSQLDARGADWVRRASEGAHRLETLIDNLLLYSRLDSRAEPFDPVDCRTVLTMALEGIEALICETDAVVTSGELPTVLGDLTQLVQLFQNLVGNGIKYRGAFRPRIHISAKRQKGEWLFSVTDNGIGIDPEHHERVFELFRRLHTQKAFPGDGIGLTLCRRIVGRHGGKIWLESELGKGSTFFFTISNEKEVEI
jgi:PAS domain S-box-containing protein